MVGIGHGAQHVVCAQPGTQALQQVVQAVTHTHVVGQQAGGRAGQRGGFQRAHMQVQSRCVQRDARQVLSQQALHVGHVQRGLSGTHSKLTPGRVLPAGVQLPAQLQRQNAALSRLQPHVQLRQQAARAKHQGRGVVDARGELQPGLKHSRQFQPGVQLGFGTIGAVQRIDKPRTKTPHQAATR